MQTRSFRGSGEPAWVNASPNARFRLGPDPRRALGPAAIRAASTGRTHDRTRPMLHLRKKALVNQAPSTHDPERTFIGSLASPALLRGNHATAGKLKAPGGHHEDGTWYQRLEHHACCDQLSARAVTVRQRHPGHSRQLRA